VAANVYRFGANLEAEGGGIFWEAYRPRFDLG
jgi:hypothetical protein